MSNGNCSKPWPLSLRMKGRSRGGQKWGREAARGESEAAGGRRSLTAKAKAKSRQKHSGGNVVSERYVTHRPKGSPAWAAAVCLS